MDPKDQGVAAHWYEPSQRFPDRIQVPGTWQAQGFGKRETVPAPARQIGSEVGPQTQYLGTAWYKRSVLVPNLWPSQKVWLSIGAVNPSAEVWVNGKPAGEMHQPGIPARFDVTGLVRAGKQNDITIRVYERNRGLGNWYNLVASWSGVWRSVSLDITRESWIDGVRVLPDVDGARAVFTTSVGGPSRGMTIRVSLTGQTAAHTIEGPGEFTMAVNLSNTRLWSPDDPYLYRAHVELAAAGEPLDSVETRFGMRKVEVRGDRLLLNNHPLYLRGYGDDGMYPLSLHPEVDSHVLRSRLALVKQYGFNLAYPCVFMPPAEFLDAADETGMFVHFDAPATLAFERHGPGGLPLDSSERDGLIREQWIAALRLIQSHPSVIILAPGSEIRIGELHLSALYRLARELDSTRLIMSWSGERGAADLGDVGTLWEPLDPSEQLHLLMRGARWRDSRKIPVLAHEYCGAEALPDPADIPKYGHGLNPAPESELLAAARARGIENLLPELVANSRKLAAVARQEEIEEVRKVPQLAGYHMWLIQDIPGYPQGIFDAFWRAKSLSPEDFARSNGETVILMNEASCRTRRCFRSGEVTRFEVWISQHGPAHIGAGTLQWSVAAPDGTTLASGKEAVPGVKPFSTIKLLDLDARMPQVQSPTRARLMLALEDVRNYWDIWLFPPAAAPAEPAVVVAGHMDAALAAQLAGGGRVLLLQHPSADLLDRGVLVRTQFMPRWPLTNGQNISATLIQKHASLGAFPHQRFCAYQFYNLIVYPPGSLPLPRDSGVLVKRPEFNRGLGVAFNLDMLGHLDPVIRVFGKEENRGYLFEARVGKGRLLATTLRLAETKQDFPEAAWLMRQLIEYAESNAFDPTTVVPPEKLKVLMEP
jgi:hypothetical protein